MSGRTVTFTEVYGHVFAQCSCGVVVRCPPPHPAVADQPTARGNLAVAVGVAMLKQHHCEAPT